MKNMNIRYSIGSAILAFIFSSCGEDGALNCMKSTGEVVSEIRSVNEFTEVEIGRRIEVVLVPDQSNYVVITAGGNLMSGIETQFEKGKLTINNNNKCNWLRSYKTSVTAEIHFKKLNKITNFGTGTIRTQGAITNDSITFEFWNSATSASVEVNNKNVFTIQHVGPNDITLSGKTDNLIAYGNDLAVLNADSLKADFVSVYWLSQKDASVQANQYLLGELTSDGNLYWRGTAEILKNITTGKGRIIVKP